MPAFQTGSCLRMTDGTRLVIDRCIGSGTQADIYSALDVDRGQRVAVKHLYGTYSTDPEKHYRKCAILARSNSPHPDLVWPTSISELTADKGFLYAMPLVTGYEPISLIVKEPARISDAQRKQLCLKLADIFMSLHQLKWVYGDISGGNILYCILSDGTVDLKVIDVDNVIPEGANLGMNGTGLYRAPALIRGEGIPSVSTDIHAIAVLTYRLYLGCHPLDGARSRSQPFTPENVQRFFGKDPRFVFDGSSNPPSEAVRLRWNSLPRPLQLYYTLMFSHDCLHGKHPRPDLSTFVRLMNQIP